jgi:hypothetical protein
MTSAPSESQAMVLWQAAMAAIIVAALGGVKPGPQIVLLAALVILVGVQRMSSAAVWARRLRTGLLVLSTCAGTCVAGYVIAVTARPPPEHPVMPIAELAMGIIAGASAGIAVLWRRSRRPAPVAEPRLARVVEVFALAAAVRVAVDAVG